MGSTGFEAKREALLRFFVSRQYELLITALIAINAVALAAESYPAVEQRVGGLLNFINAVVLIVFVLELAAKIAVSGRAFWREPWNWFDLFVVVASVLPASDAFSALRALRVLRLLRLVSVIPSLRRVVEGLIKAIPGLASIMALLVLLLFVFAVVGTRLFGEAHPEFFGTLGTSAFNLFTVMTLEGWPDLARTVMKTHPAAWAFFIVFIMLSSWAVLNLVIGVIVDSMQASARAEEEALDNAMISAQRQTASEIAQLRREIAELKAALARPSPSPSPAAE